MSQTPHQDSRYRSIDVWRGVFCILVVLEHAGVVLWTRVIGDDGSLRLLKWRLVQPLLWNLGAPLFFVVSGYCIAASIESHRRKGKAAAQFLLRRFWRIFPPYWASLFLLIAMVVLLDSVGLRHWHHNAHSLELASLSEIKPLHWLGNLTLTETWRHKITGSSVSMLVVTRVAWSLCYQEQFYLICVALLVVFPRHYGRSLAWATAAIVAYYAFKTDVGAETEVDGLFPKLWHEFAVGLGVYWRLNGGLSTIQKRGIELALVALLVVSCRQGMTTSIAAAGLGLALIALRPFDATIDRLRWLDPLRACGRRSYSIYLIHLPACVLIGALSHELGVRDFWHHLAFTVPLAMAASLGAGWLFHRWIDTYFTQLPQFRKPLIGQPLSQPAPSLGDAARA